MSRGHPCGALSFDLAQGAPRRFDLYWIDRISLFPNGVDNANQTRQNLGLVADGAKARLLERVGANAPQTPVSDEGFSESEARTPSRDLGTDRPGSVQESANAARHAMEPRVDWHRYAKEQFAKSVAGALEKSALTKKFQALILVAPPRALGDLRADLGQHAKALVAGEVAKDLTNLPDHELSAHLE